MRRTRDWSRCSAAVTGSMSPWPSCRQRSIAARIGSGSCPSRCVLGGCQVGMTVGNPSLPIGPHAIVNGQQVRVCAVNVASNVTRAAG